jgi:hypothetical protein
LDDFEKYDAMYGQCGLRIFDVLLFLFAEYKGSSGCLVLGGRSSSGVGGWWERGGKIERMFFEEVGMDGLCFGGVEVEGRGRRQLFLKSNAHASGITATVSGGKAIRWNLGGKTAWRSGDGGAKSLKFMISRYCREI